jgi:hypothetical protein
VLRLFCPRYGNRSPVVITAGEALPRPLGHSLSSSHNSANAWLPGASGHVAPDEQREAPLQATQRMRSRIGSGLIGFTRNRVALAASSVRFSPSAIDSAVSLATRREAQAAYELLRKCRFRDFKFAGRVIGLPGTPKSRKALRYNYSFSDVRLARSSRATTNAVLTRVCDDRGSNTVCGRP